MVELTILINVLIIDLFFIYHIIRELKYMYEYEQEKRIKRVVSKMMRNIK